ncbi:MAG TPA: hypothetical protein VKR58_15095 [Aquella sp.]|nr:hypothetical protein [Aquella sp.]
MKKVNIPGIGILSFPDEMSEEDMHNAIQKNYPNLNGNVQQKPVNEIPQKGKNSFLDTIANNPITDTIIGMGDAPNNFVRQTHNFIAPKSMQVPLVKNSSGLAYEGGNFLGDLATFGAGSAGLNAARGAAEAIPYAGRAAEYLGGKGLAGLARRGIGAGAYGAIETPEHRGRGALEGAALSGGLDTITGGIGKILPKRYLGEVYNTVSKGLGSAKSESKKMYGEVMKPFGWQPISLKGINPDIFQGNAKLKTIWSKFQDNPNIENAHKLQSQIGATDRRLKYGIDAFTNDRKDALQSSRESILNSIRKALGSKYPKAREIYDAATNHYRENVVPYDITNKSLRKIIDPTPEKVARKLDAVTKMEAYPKNKVGEDYEPIIPKGISEVGEELSNKIRNRNVAKTVGGFLGGGLIGRAVGAPLIGEIIGAYLGAKSADPLRKITSGQPGIGNLSALQRLYSNVIGGGDWKKDIIKTQTLRDESPILDYLTRNKKKSKSTL